MRYYSAPVSLLSKNAVPPELQGYIDRDVWADIVRRMFYIQRDGEAAACCIEWMVCLFTGFFCIFCCHPAITACMSGNDAVQTERDLNYRYFGGAPVVQIIGVRQ